MKFKISLLALLVSFSIAAQTPTVISQNPTVISENPTESDNSKALKYRLETGYGQQFRYGTHHTTTPYHQIRVGMNVEIPFEYGLALETGLKYSLGFGQRNQFYAHNDTANFKYMGHSLDIPVRASFTLPIVWGIKAFAYAGPNFNIGLAHTDKVTLTQHEVDPAPTHPVELPQPGKHNTYKNEIHRFNLQLGAGGGLQWRNYRVKSGYEWGINSVSRNKNYPQRIRGWHVAFEYEF